MDATIRQTAREWVANDVDPLSREQLDDLLARSDAGSVEAAQELTERMSGLPRFGTAGMRAPVRAGANGMNRSVVIRTTAGLADWLRRAEPGGLVFVGRDARHGSEAFAREAAAVLAAAGFDARLLADPLPTPVLAHVTRARGAAAGIQITASHNPPADNGYKLYLRGGVQPVAPTDAEIENGIAASAPAAAVPRADTWQWCTDALEGYLDRVIHLTRRTDRSAAPRVAATALHGVGAGPLREALRRCGVGDVSFVPEQEHPDPEFPTVNFPNPEEPGATDALLRHAQGSAADLAIALDPDADRCALGVADGGRWRMLRGDETGVLLGWHVLSTLGGGRAPVPLVASTLVSATMLGRMAEDFGVRHAETPTGFKWLVRAGDGRGTGLVYAYEEALGHCVDPEHVRDKDGISAAVLCCDLAARLAAQGRGLPDLLDELFLRYGVHSTDQVSLRVSDGAERAARLRERPPAELAGTPLRLRDPLSATDALVLTGDGGTRVVIRPSGTEPKLKCYLQVVEHPAPEAHAGDAAAALAAAKQRASDRLARLGTAVAELLAPDEPAP
ncbi:phospho-sugar mutase [Salinifilum aidingensis]